MSGIKNRTVALGAVLLMCMTVLAGVSVVSDDSDAYSFRTYGTISHPISGTCTLYTSDDYTGSYHYVHVMVTPGTAITVVDSAAHPGSSDSHNGWSVSGNTYTKTMGTVREDTLAVSNVWYIFYPVATPGTIDIYNWVAAGQGATTASDPATAINTNEIEWLDPQHYYVARGSPIYAYESGEDFGAYLTTPIPGLTMSNSILSGTATTNGTYTVCTEILPIGETDRGFLTVVDPVPEYTHTLAYSGNGNTGGSMNNVSVTDSNSGSISVTLGTCGYTKTGYTFTGWLVGSTVYQPGQTVSVGADATVTATAQWSKNTLTASANSLSAMSGQAYSNQIGASANNGGTVTYAVKSCTGGNATVNSNGLVTYTAPIVDSTANYTVTVTVSASFPTGDSQSKDVSFTVIVDPVLSFTNASTSGTLSVKGA